MARKPKETLRQARSELYRRHILEAAEDVFATRGFENARVQDIAAAAGLSMGTLYSVFPGKEELFAALLESRGEALLEVARSARNGGRDPREALDRLIERYVGWFVEHPAFLRMHLGLGSSWVLEPRGRSDRQVRIWQEIHEIQSGIFRQGIADGVFVDEDPELLAKLFSAMDQTVLADWAAHGMKAGAGEVVARLRRFADRALVREG